MLENNMKIILFVFSFYAYAMYSPHSPTGSDKPIVEDPTTSFTHTDTAPKTYPTGNNAKDAIFRFTQFLPAKQSILYALKIIIPAIISASVIFAILITSEKHSSNAELTPIICPKNLALTCLNFITNFIVQNKTLMQNINTLLWLNTTSAWHVVFDPFLNQLLQTDSNNSWLSPSILFAQCAKEYVPCIDNSANCTVDQLRLKLRNNKIERPLSFYYDSKALRRLVLGCIKQQSVTKSQSLAIEKKTINPVKKHTPTLLLKFHTKKTHTPSRLTTPTITESHQLKRLRGRSLTQEFNIKRRHTRSFSNELSLGKTPTLSFDLPTIDGTKSKTGSKFHTVDSFNTATQSKKVPVHNTVTSTLAQTLKLTESRSYSKESAIDKSVSSTFSIEQLPPVTSSRSRRASHSTHEQSMSHSMTNLQSKSETGSRVSSMSRTTRSKSLPPSFTISISNSRSSSNQPSNSITLKTNSNTFSDIKSSTDTITLSDSHLFSKEKSMIQSNSFSPTDSRSKSVDKTFSQNNSASLSDSNIVSNDLSNSGSASTSGSFSNTDSSPVTNEKSPTLSDSNIVSADLSQSVTDTSSNSISNTDTRTVTNEKSPTLSDSNKVSADLSQSVTDTSSNSISNTDTRTVTNEKSPTLSDSNIVSYDPSNSGSTSATNSISNTDTKTITDEKFLTQSESNEVSADLSQSTSPSKDNTLNPSPTRTCTKKKNPQSASQTKSHSKSNFHRKQSKSLSITRTSEDALCCSLSTVSRYNPNCCSRNSPLLPTCCSNKRTNTAIAWLSSAQAQVCVFYSMNNASYDYRTQNCCAIDPAEGFPLPACNAPYYEQCALLGNYPPNYCFTVTTPNYPCCCPLFNAALPKC